MLGARMFDVIVVGGGSAGLSAALMLGRRRRRVLVCDLGRPRNRRSRALHGYLTRDGIAPAAFNNLGRVELARYGVAFRRVGVRSVRRSGRGSRASLANGRTKGSRFLLIATGVVDCTNGRRLAHPARERLRRNAIAVCTEPIARLTHTGEHLTAIVFRSGEIVDRDALFFSTGPLINTNVAGVFVAGDASRDAQFVVAAAAEGVKAAMTINQALQREELAA